MAWRFRSLSIAAYFPKCSRATSATNSWRNYVAAGVILSDSHSSTLEGESPRAPEAVFELDVPVLGICYGMQTMAAQLGCKVENGLVREGVTGIR